MLLGAVPTGGMSNMSERDAPVGLARNVEAARFVSDERSETSGEDDR
jgi:hypothetical protein